MKTALHLLAALCALCTLAPAAAHDEPRARTLTVAAGAVASSRLDGAPGAPSLGPVLGAVLGVPAAERARLELEVGVDRPRYQDADVALYTLGANGIYTLAGSHALVRPEIGVGLGWTLASDLCTRTGRLAVCDGASNVLWNVQAVLGATGRLTERTRWELRYRMRHVGSLARGERFRTFTLGVRVAL